MTTHDEPPTSERRIGRYVVRSVLGRGSFSEVFLADDPAFERPVAIKLLSEHASCDLELRRRFVRESRFMRAADRQRIATVFDIGEHGTRPYFVMEAFSESLATRIDGLGETRPTIGGILRLVDELADCLIDLKVANLVHRDFKPSNLLIRTATAGAETGQVLGPGERLVVVDLGLAKDVRSSAITLGAGSVGFMAPEQQQPGRSVDHRADLYSATIIVAQLLDAAGIQHPDLDAVIRRGTAPDMNNRFGSAEEWAGSFRAALAQQRDVNNGAEDNSGRIVRLGKSLLPPFVVGAALATAIVGVSVRVFITPGAYEIPTTTPATAEQSDFSVPEAVDNGSGDLPVIPASSVVYSERCLEHSPITALEGQPPGWYVEKRIVRGAHGQPVVIRGVEWPGLNEEQATLSGLDSRPLADLTNQIAMLGFNTIRIPVDPILLADGVKAVAVHPRLNPELASADAITVLDCAVAGAAREGLAIVLALDPARDQTGQRQRGNSTADRDAIAMLSDRYRSWPNVVGIDIGGSADNNGCWSCSAGSIDASAVVDTLEQLESGGSKWLVFTPNPDIPNAIADRVVWASRVDPPSVFDMHADTVDEMIDHMGIKATVVVGLGELPVNRLDRMWMADTLRRLEVQGQFGFVLRSLHSGYDPVGGILAADGFSVKQTTMDEVGRFLTGPFRIEVFIGDTARQGG